MKLIDKDAIVAEIESLLDKGKYHDEYDCAYHDGNNGALYALKEKVNSLEVKEVELEKEIDRELETRWRGEYLYTSKFRESAKHFFELGLMASNSLTWEDIANINDIVSEIVKECNNNILYDNREDFCKEVLKRFKAQKGEGV